MEDPTANERKCNTPKTDAVDGPETTGSADVLDVLTLPLIIHAHVDSPS
jgi:hypothetical protein